MYLTNTTSTNCQPCQCQCHIPVPLLHTSVTYQCQCHIPVCVLHTSVSVTYQCECYIPVSHTSVRVTSRVPSLLLEHNPSQWQPGARAERLHGPVGREQTLPDPLLGPLHVSIMCLQITCVPLCVTSQCATGMINIHTLQYLLGATRTYRFVPCAMPSVLHYNHNPQ